MKNILLIPRIKIHNANALSSPYTIGFPAMTAWLGSVHAIERKLKETEFDNIQFKSMAVICHSIDLQTHKGNGDYVHSIIGSGNPLDKSGKRPSFIEEARCHLTVSLVIECSKLGLFVHEEFYKTINHIIQGKMKFAGGDLLSALPSELFKINDVASRRKLLRRLMPGHCLIERRDLVKREMEDGKDGIDAILEYLKVTHSCEVDEKEKVKWNSSRKEKGWLVPIATGFHGITELGEAKNQRDPDAPHRFAEAIITLGEFVMPYRIDDLDDMLWHYHADMKASLYICQQNKPFMEKQGE
jgi:CRISPR-associated protein Csy2